MIKIPDSKYIDDYKKTKEKYTQSTDGGTVHVNSYTKSDGTDVCSHTRSAPSR